MASSETPSRLQISLESCKDISKCIICQKLKENKGDQKFTGTEKGRGIIVECSELLNDELLEYLVANMRTFNITSTLGIRVM